MKNFIKKINKTIFLLFFLFCVCFFNVSLIKKRSIRLKVNNSSRLISNQKQEIIKILKYEWQKVVKLLAEITLIKQLIVKTKIKYEDKKKKSFSLKYKEEKDDLTFKYIEQKKDEKNNRVFNVLVSNYKLSGITFIKSYNFILKGFTKKKEFPTIVRKLFNYYIFLQKIFKVKIKLFLFSKLLLNKKKSLFLRSQNNDFVIGYLFRAFLFKVEKNNKKIKKIFAFKRITERSFQKLTNVSIEVEKKNNYESKITKIIFHKKNEEEKKEFSKLKKNKKVKEILKNELEKKFKLLSEMMLIKQLLDKITFLDDQKTTFNLQYKDNRDNEINFIYEKQIDKDNEKVILVSALHYQLSQLWFLNRFKFFLKFKKQEITKKELLWRKQNFLILKLVKENQKINAKKNLFNMWKSFNSNWKHNIFVDLRNNIFEYFGYIFKFEKNNKDIKKIIMFKTEYSNYIPISNIKIRITKIFKKQFLIKEIIFSKKLKPKININNKQLKIAKNELENFSTPITEKKQHEKENLLEFNTNNYSFLVLKEIPNLIFKVKPRILKGYKYTNLYLEDDKKLFFLFDKKISELKIDNFVEKIYSFTNYKKQHNSKYLEFKLKIKYNNIEIKLFFSKLSKKLKKIIFLFNEQRLFNLRLITSKWSVKTNDLTGNFEKIFDNTKKKVKPIIELKSKKKVKLKRELKEKNKKTFIFLLVLVPIILIIFIFILWKIKS